MGKTKGAVLVVDDDADIRDTLSEVLAEEGYRPVGAENGRQALEALQGIPKPCLVLLDLMMPVMNGHEFLKHVRASPDLCSKLRVVVCTASTTLPTREAPVEAILSKPFEMGDLFEVLAQHGCA